MPAPKVAGAPDRAPGTRSGRPVPSPPRDRLLRCGPQPARRPILHARGCRRRHRGQDPDRGHARPHGGEQPALRLHRGARPRPSAPPSATSRPGSGKEGPGTLETGRLSPAFLADVDQGAMGGVAAAPVLIVVCRRHPAHLRPESLDSSVFPAVQNLLLAAHALGLGSTLTTLPVLSGNDLSDALDLPTEVRAPSPWSPSGISPQTLGPPRRLPMSEKAHLEPLRGAVPRRRNRRSPPRFPHRPRARRRPRTPRERRRSAP